MSFLRRTVTLSRADNGKMYFREADGTVLPLNRTGYATGKGAWAALERYYVTAYDEASDTHSLIGLKNAFKRIDPRDAVFVDRMIDHDIAQEEKARVATVPSESELRATTDAELTPVTHSLVETAHVSVTIPDARPVLYFEQDGGHFCYRDRPFYYVDFHYVGPDGMSAGVCPTFSTVAPFPVSDFNMLGAYKALDWFADEAAKAGFRVERAPDYYRTTKPVPCHPDEELADLAYARHPDRDLTSIAEFVAYRATPQAPVVRETFDTFEPWSKAYLNLIENWYGVDVATHAAELCEEYYTESLTPIAAANKYVSVYITAG